jgi:hypothetical protein
MQMLLILFIMPPGLIASFSISVISGGNGLMKYVYYLVLIGYNMIACVIMAILSKGIFEELEMD